MAINIRVNTPNLELDETHVGTIIEIYEDVDLTIPFLIDSISPPNSLTNFSYGKEVVPKHEYYVRGRYIFDPGGLQGYSDVSTFIGGDTNDILINLHAPQIVRPPLVTLDGGTTDTKHIDLVFRQNTEIQTNHSIKHVSWILTDSKNVVRFSSLEDTTNINSIVVDTTLRQSDFFIMRCMVTLDTDSTSMLGSIHFSTGKLVDKALRFNLDLGDLTDTTIVTPTKAFIYPIPNSLSKNVNFINFNGSLGSYEFYGEEINLLPFTENENNYAIKVTALMQDDSILGPIYYYVHRESASLIGYPKAIPVAGE